jgi:hypothetical protein
LRITQPEFNSGSVNNDKAEEIITYNKMLEYITRDEESVTMWKFQRIISHEVQGSKITLLIEWENGEITKEPLCIIAVDDPVTCAIYARENGLKKFTRIWLTKANLSLSIQPLNISMAMKFQGPMNKLGGLIRIMGTPYGEMPPFLN